MFRDYERFADDILTLNGFFGERAIGVKHEFNRFDQICAGFRETGRLRICARQLLDEGNVTFGNATKDGSELHMDSNTTTECYQYSPAPAQDAPRRANRRVALARAKLKLRIGPSG